MFFNISILSVHLFWPFFSYFKLRKSLIFNKSSFDFNQKDLDLSKQFYFERDSRNHLTRESYLNKTSYVRRRRINFLHSWVLVGRKIFNKIFSAKNQNIYDFDEDIIEFLDRDSSHDTWTKSPEVFENGLQRKEAFHELPLFIRKWYDFVHFNQYIFDKYGIENLPSQIRRDDALIKAKARKSIKVYALQWSSATATNEYSYVAVDLADSADLANFGAVYDYFRIRKAVLEVIPWRVPASSDYGLFFIAQIPKDAGMSSSVAVAIEEIDSPKLLIPMPKYGQGVSRRLDLQLESEDKEWREIGADGATDFARIGYALYDHGFGATTTRHYHFVVHVDVEFA